MNRVYQEVHVFHGKKVIALGDRDGIQGPAIARCLESAGAEVVFSSTDCIVWSAAGAMDLENQARVKELTEQFGPDNLVVVIGSLDTGGTEISALTVTSGDPTYAGPLAGVPLGLPVYHMLEQEVRQAVDPEIYKEEVELMEMAMEENAEEIITITRKVRAGDF